MWIKKEIYNNLMKENYEKKYLLNFKNDQVHNLCKKIKKLEKEQMLTADKNKKIMIGKNIYTMTSITTYCEADSVDSATIELKRINY